MGHYKKVMLLIYASVTSDSETLSIQCQIVQMHYSLLMLNMLPSHSKTIQSNYGAFHPVKVKAEH